jgi:hypothetical protein
MIPRKYPVVQFCTSNSTHIKTWKLVISALRQKNSQLKTQVLSLDSYYAQSPVTLAGGVNADDLHVLERRWSKVAYWKATGLHRMLLVFEAIVRVNLMLRKTYPDLVVLGNDIGVIETIIIKAATSLRIPTILVQDGILNGNLRRENVAFVGRAAKIRKFIFALLGINRNHIYGHGNATAMAVMGQYTYDLFQDEGKDMSEVYITGLPRFDEYAKIVHSGYDNSRSVETRRKHQIPGSTFTIGFFTQPFISYGLMEPAKWDFIVETVLASICEAMEEIDCRLIIKLHPAESATDFFERYSQHMSALGDRVVLDEKIELLNVIQMADLVIVYSSTVSLEAILFDKPVIVFDPYEFLDDYKFAGMGAVVHVATKDDLVGNVLSFKKNSEVSSRMRAARARAVNYHLSNFDGLASSRVADLILKYLIKLD